MKNVLLILSISGLIFSLGCISEDQDGDGLMASRDCDDLNPDIGYDLFDGTVDSDWASFCDAASCLRQIEGDLDLSDATPDDVRSLSCIGYITGDLIVIGNKVLNNLEGLEEVERIGTRLNIQSSRLKNLNGLDTLSSIGLSLILTETYLETASGLGNLEDIAWDLDIDYNPFLTDVGSLQNLNRVGGHFTVIGNESLCPSDAEGLLESIDEVGGIVSVHTNTCSEY